MNDVGGGWLRRIEGGAETLAAVLVALSAVLVFLGVLLRNVFGTSPSWVVEAPIYTFVWAMFLVLGGTFQRGLHLGIDIIVARLPVGTRRAFAIFGSIAMALIAAILMWLGADLVIRQFVIGAVSNTALRMPLYIVSAAMPIGFGLLLLRAVADVMTRGSDDTPDLVLPGEGV